jgi:hypothetical protein
MATFGLQGTRDVLAVILQIHIVGLAHVRIPMTGAANGFRGFNPVTAKAAALELGRATRWDRVRLNRLAGSIPVATALALAGPRGTRDRTIS